MAIGFTKNHILAEIQRTAGENGGFPLGRQRFYTETGIKNTDWCGKYWVRWADALKEAGFQPNRLTTAYDHTFLLEKLACLVRELGHFPVYAELRMKARQDTGFPSHTTFARLGDKKQLAAAVIAYCNQHGGFEDVIQVCANHSVSDGDATESPTPSPVQDEELGFVYLLKSGRYYKVGRSNAAGRRERELALQLPERARLVHAIKTDDPAGIEFYWHRRFESKRKNGEWFDLTSEDVAVFKRRKFM